MCVKVYGNWWCESCSICTEAIPSFWCTIQKFLLRVYIPGAIQITVVLSFLGLLSCTPFSRREFYKHLTHKPGMGKWQWKYPHVLSYLEKFTLFFVGVGVIVCMEHHLLLALRRKDMTNIYVFFRKGWEMVAWAEGFIFYWLNEWRNCTSLSDGGEQRSRGMAQLSGMGWNEAKGSNFLTKDTKYNLSMV